MIVLAMELSRVERPRGFPRARSPLTTDFGGHCVWVTPVPIPNTEVKPDRADGTWVDSPWESRSPPDFSRRPAASAAGLRRFRAEIGRSVGSPDAREPPPVRLPSPLGPRGSRWCPVGQEPWWHRRRTCRAWRTRGRRWFRPWRRRRSTQRRARRGRTGPWIVGALGRAGRRRRCSTWRLGGPGHRAVVEPWRRRRGLGRRGGTRRLGSRWRWASWRSRRRDRWPGSPHRLAVGDGERSTGRGAPERERGPRWHEPRAGRTVVDRRGASAGVVARWRRARVRW